jgi:glycerate 2-kinase
MTAFFGATMRSGFEVVAEATGLSQRLKSANLCMSGEGKLDSQSLAGKTCIGVARMCNQFGVPCVAIVGSVGAGAEAALREGLREYVVIGEGLPLEESMRRAPKLLRAAARGVVSDALARGATK